MPPATSEAACSKCKGAGYFCLDVPVGDPNFGQLMPCDCRMAEKEERRRQQQRDISNLMSMEDKTFKNFNPDVPGVRAAFTLCKTYSQKPEGWLFLFGSVGCGKTHLAAAIANEVLSREGNLIWTVVPDLLDYLRAAFNPAGEVNLSYEQRFDQVRNIPLLVLDDLGTETATPWAREKLFQIINHRYNSYLPTVITSNQDLDRIDPRIRSRVGDVAICTSMLMNAGDFRRLSIEQRFKPFRSFGR